ncbi:MAG TPA: helix-turn-helix domain-containing protein [Caproicibacter sp.]|nr:helix-turn-helix domain-containing protein [Caproicibacter sp.]
MDITKEWNYEQFILHESNFIHAPYEPEFAFYTAVKSGDINRVTKLCENNFIKTKGLGKLSDNPLHNAVYHFIITVALVARYCIDGGMEHEVAYGLSDFYIQKADKCTTAEEISRLHSIMSIDYTKRMNVLKKNKIYSKPVAECIDYIYGNLHLRITLAMLANYVDLNPDYLSRLFKKVTGIPVSQYIQHKKIEAAQNMLRYMDCSTSLIASTLAFPTQSYFTKVFKKQVGMTPTKYREFWSRKFQPTTAGI